MPRPTAVQLSKTEQARAYIKANKLRFDAAYHLALAAMRADGVAPRELPERVGVPMTEAGLSPEDQQALSAAKSALGL